MKRVVTILVCLSLLVPHAAKMMAYVDCSFVMLSNSDPDFCDCNLVVAADMLPLIPDMPDKQKELSLKADWKYVATPVFECSTGYDIAAKNILFSPDEPLKTQQLQSVFHPPRC